jgi:UDP-N-acetylglucosamine diphosphorylase / glucose-1-phosphate thymidylyltransferase / UDP-N-acetylgalactosamine diphosphorylase / glucosamine-1-phosphate N-acetyltransferase / galactosamine-1-phosphate N-acetyltransferase
MNIVIPLAGLGSRFADAGYLEPKPLIYFRGKTMIEHAIESIGIYGKFIFITRLFLEPYHSRLMAILLKYTDEKNIVVIEKPTRGSAETILQAKDLIRSHTPLLQTNCDQILRWGPQDFLDHIYEQNCHGSVVTTSSTEKKHSYVKLNKQYYAEEFAEKNPISNQALVGVHYWERGYYFVDAAERMILENNTQNGEFYVSASYNYMLRNFKDNGKKCNITSFQIHGTEINFLGTPEDLNQYKRIWKC